jgi:hypothetical protein
MTVDQVSQVAALKGDHPMILPASSSTVPNPIITNPG